MKKTPFINVIFFCLTFVFSLFHANAAIDPEYILEKIKVTTPTFSEDTFKPQNFTCASNLIMKNGSPFVAKGIPIRIKLYVVDLLSLPVADVTVKFYHANYFGYYNYATEQDDLEKYDLDLVDTGMVVTNNVGFADILTIIPGQYANRSPHVHMIIEYKEANGIKNSFETQMFFENHPDNLKDPVFSKLNKIQRNLLICKVDSDDKENRTCKFNIRLNTIQKYKSL